MELSVVVGQSFNRSYYENVSELIQNKASSESLQNSDPGVQTKVGLTFQKNKTQIKGFFIKRIRLNTEPDLQLC